MADPSARPGLLSIAVPRYPSSAGSRDLPTGERIPPNDDAGDPYNIAATRIPDAAFVQNNLDHNVKLEAIPHWPSFTCYRNASLAALFNVAPFINFLERVSRQRRIPNDMYRQLLNVCDLFRNKHGIGSREREIQYKDAVIDFWNSLDKESSLMNSTRTIRSWQAYCGDDKQSLPRSQQNLQELTAEKKKKRRHRVHDSNEFIIYLLERFIYGELDKEMVDTEVNVLSIAQKLFEFATVARMAFDCCPDVKGTKQRIWDTAGPGGVPGMLEVNFEAGKHSLADAVATKFYDPVSRERFCHECGNGSTLPRFYKLLYLPEFLFIGTNYWNGNGGSISSSKCDIPEYLDMSQLVDGHTSAEEPEVAGKAKGLYRLESVIGFPICRIQDTGHYVAWVRRGEDRWGFVNDVPDRNEQSRYTFRQMIRQERFRSRNLLYVRIRDVDIKDVEAGKTQAVHSPPLPPRRPPPAKRDLFGTTQYSPYNGSVQSMEASHAQMEKEQREQDTFSAPNGEVRREENAAGASSAAPATGSTPNNPFFVANSDPLEGGATPEERGLRLKRRKLRHEKEAERLEPLAIINERRAGLPKEAANSGKLGSLGHRPPVAHTPLWQEDMGPSGGSSDRSSSRDDATRTRLPPPPTGSNRPPEPPRVPWSIGADPSDPRLAASESWDVARFKAEFRSEGIAHPTGNKASAPFWLRRWRQHFDQKERLYDIYSLERLKEAAREHSIEVGPQRKSKIPRKKHYINALKREDERRLYEYSINNGRALNDTPDSGDEDDVPPPPLSNRKRKYDDDPATTDDGEPEQSEGSEAPEETDGTDVSPIWPNDAAMGYNDYLEEDIDEEEEEEDGDEDTEDDSADEDHDA